MVQFKVGDTVTLCASVADFCTYYNQLYYIYDINAAVGICDITIDPVVECLSLSGVLLEFQWTNSQSSTPTHNCTEESKLKVLGSAYTNAQGVASISYVITEEDLTFHDANPVFDLRVCIKNKSTEEVINFGDILGGVDIIPDPCAGITCENVCFGTDLWTQRCENGTCVADVNLGPNPACGATVETHYLYFKVPESYPASFVYSKIADIFEVAGQAISDYVDYSITGVDFDSSKYVITVTITKTGGLGRINAMIAPIVVVLGLIAIFIISSFLIWFQFWYMGSKSVTGEPTSTRVITVVPQICTGDASSGTLTCDDPTPEQVISVEYCLGDECHTMEITDGNPKTFTAPTDVSISVIGKVKDNPYYTVIKKMIDKGTTNETVPLNFMAMADANITPRAVGITAGTYVIYETTTTGEKVEIQKGDLAADGSIPNMPPLKAGVETCISIIPADWPIHDPTYFCTIPTAGETDSPEIIITTCLEAKNHVSLRTVYIGQDGGRYGFTADSLEIKIGTNIILTVTPTSDITYIDGLDKDTVYTMHAIKSGYDITNNDQTFSFTTDCGTTTALMMEADPPLNTRDITITVNNSVTSAPIQGANVFLDSMSARITNVSGQVFYTAIPDGDHDLRIALEGYQENTSTINVSSTSTTFTKTLTVQEVYADIDTRIENLASVGDLIATKPVKFKGSLRYLDGTTYKPLKDATVTVTVKDTSDQTLKTLTAVTQSGILGTGDFETGEWVVPEVLVGTEVSVCASFDGVGRYKPSSSCTSYAVADASSCVIPLPWGGCLLSKETGQGLLMLGAVVLLGGFVLTRGIGGRKQI